VRFGRPRKLTQHQRQEAIQRLSAGETQMDIAHSFNVHHTTIGRLATASPFAHGAVIIFGTVAGAALFVSVINFIWNFRWRDFEHQGNTRTALTDVVDELTKVNIAYNRLEIDYPQSTDATIVSLRRNYNNQRRRLLRFEASRDRRKLRHLTTRLRHFDTQIAKPALQPDLLSQHRELPPPQLERATNGADPVFRLVCELPHDC